MKTHLLVASTLVVLVAFTGCSKKEETVAPVTAAAPAVPAGPRAIQITANDAMKFNVTSISLAVGEEVRLVFTNSGTMPKQAMGHNVVVLKAGSDVDAFAKAAGPATATDYIPAALAGEIIAHTKLLGPKESDSIVVKFSAAGEYPFLCSFPAHAQLGMKGVISVK